MLIGAGPPAPGGLAGGMDGETRRAATPPSSAQPAATRGIDDLSLVEEIDDKLLPEAHAGDDARPAAARRAGPQGDAAGHQARRGGRPGLNLDAQRDAFAGMPALYAIPPRLLGLRRSAARPLPCSKGCPTTRGGATGTICGSAASFCAAKRWTRRVTATPAASGASSTPARTGRSRARSWSWLLALPRRAAWTARRRLRAGLARHRSDDADRILLEHDAGPALLRARANGTRRRLPTSGPRRPVDAALQEPDARLLRGFPVRPRDRCRPPTPPPKDAASPSGDRTPVGPGVFAHGTSAGEIGCPPLPDDRCGNSPGIRPRSAAGSASPSSCRLNGMDGRTALDKSAAGGGARQNAPDGVSGQALRARRHLCGDHRGPPRHRPTTAPTRSTARCGATSPRAAYGMRRCRTRPSSTRRKAWYTDAEARLYRLALGQAPVALVVRGSGAGRPGPRRRRGGAAARLRAGRARDRRRRTAIAPSGSGPA